MDINKEQYHYINGHGRGGPSDNIYYYNPKKTSNQFMMSRPVQKVIGQHYFCT